MLREPDFHKPVKSTKPGSRPGLTGNQLRCRVELPQFAARELASQHDERIQNRQAWETTPIAGTSSARRGSAAAVARRGRPMKRSTNFRRTGSVTSPPSASGRCRVCGWAAHPLQPLGASGLHHSGAFHILQDGNCHHNVDGSGRFSVDMKFHPAVSALGVMGTDKGVDALVKPGHDV